MTFETFPLDVQVCYFQVVFPDQVFFLGVQLVMSILKFFFSLLDSSKYSLLQLYSHEADLIQFD